MWSRFWKYAIFIRVVTLVMGCGSAAPMHLQSVPSANSSDSGLHRNPMAVPSKSGANGPHRSSGTGAEVALKGKGSNTEAVSRNATAHKMGSWDVTAEKVSEVSALVEQAAIQYDVPANLIYGIIWVESRFNPTAKSPVGARGLMQLMPKTAAYLAQCMKWEGEVDSYDPAFNIAAGSYYIARLIKQFDGDLDLALAAYNAGAGNIRRWMNNTGLPDVSIEYYTMVQTAQQYFPSVGPQVSGGSQGNDGVAMPTTTDLDRLGLAILIAGLSKREFGLHRPDDADPFDEM